MKKEGKWEEKRGGPRRGREGFLVLVLQGLFSRSLSFLALVPTESLEQARTDSISVISKIFGDFVSFMIS